MPAMNATAVPPILEARGLVCSRNDEVIFGPLDLNVAAGDVVLVEGDNGSGKTTLLRVLSGLLSPSAGEVRFGGLVLDSARRLMQVALLGHQPGLKQELTPTQNLAFAVGVFGRRDGLTIDAALAATGLAGYEDVPVRQLSAGQKKRITLARLLLVPAALWLLDEPFANLDRDGIELVNRMLDEHARCGGAALVTSHGAYAFTSGSPRRVPIRVRA